MKILALDYSTTCTGWAIFDSETEKLLEFGSIAPILKGLKEFKYPKLQVKKLQRLAEQIKTIIPADVETIIIEEINGGKSGRLSQKVLDGGHFLFLAALNDTQLDKVVFLSSNGPGGWRTILGIRLSEVEKLQNKEIKKFNRKVAKGKKKVISYKNLSVNFVNSHFGLDLKLSENDIADAICLGRAYLDTVVKLKVPTQSK